LDGKDPKDEVPEDEEFKDEGDRKPQAVDYGLGGLPVLDVPSSKLSIPKYVRTRLVSVVGGKYLRCTCGYFEQWGFPCRHIYAVLKRFPSANDVIPRYHKHYTRKHSNVLFRSPN
jgi:SWIM zinc finger